MSDLPASTDLDLDQESLLYLAGELDAPHLEAFEKRLETDEAAQVQLALAVQLTELFQSKSPRPDPAYREAVRGQVLPPNRSRRWGGFRIWAEFAIAVCLLFVTWSVARIDSTTTEPLPVVATVNEELESESAVALTEEDSEKIDMAAAWAEMSNNDHYQQANEDELRRKQRFRETGQLAVPTLMEEHGVMLD